MFTSLLFAAALQAGAAVPPQAIVRRAVERLDMGSFRNSLAPAVERRPRTLRQLGNHRYAWEEGALEVTEADGSWVRIFKPLRSPRGRVRLCFTDQALNGGTYLTSEAIELSPVRGGGYRARPITHHDCESYAR